MNLIRTCSKLLAVLTIVAVFVVTSGCAEQADKSTPKTTTTKPNANGKSAGSGVSGAGGGAKTPAPAKKPDPHPNTT